MRNFIRFDKQGLIKVIIESNDPTLFFTDDLETIEITEERKNEIIQNFKKLKVKNNKIIEVSKDDKI